MDTEAQSILEITSDLMHPKINFDVHYSVIIPSRNDWIFRKEESLDADSCGCILSQSQTKISTCLVPRRQYFNEEHINWYQSAKIDCPQ